MKLNHTTIGRCLVMTVRDDLKEASSKYSRFVNFSQWYSRYGIAATELLEEVDESQVSDELRLRPGEITFGLSNDNKTIEYMGNIMDSSD